MSKPSTKSKRPVRDELELEDLANTITEAHQSKDELVLSVWRMSEKIQGRIVKLDSSTKRVHVQGYGDVRKIPFMDILKAERPEY
ncbi:hypothetical protein BEP19_15765 [Ammoniphilus oxalaticus]|uniref:YolD-like family protein n=1 Tax=Ammoniphilus oxalaticus TaxID=66863 RepID=A0A419SDF4_9BACL|nr:YolD-like family protein [Ammoniphilus oxalaticus]RKD21128.1 hypothetical protein BEP19_15765 [Ammoniphilus oxalaticus]